MRPSKVRSPDEVRASHGDVANQSRAVQREMSIRPIFPLIPINEGYGPKPYDARRPALRQAQLQALARAARVLALGQDEPDVWGAWLQALQQAS